MRNGSIAHFTTIKRDLVIAVDASLYPDIGGGTDSETLFYLALGLGLEENVPDAVARAVGLVEAYGRARDIEYPFQGTIATTDGERTWAFRYSSEGKSRSLFYTTDVPTLHKLYPDRPILEHVSADARLIVSEPIGDLLGAWNPVPEASCLEIGAGKLELLDFTAKLPPDAVPASA